MNNIVKKRNKDINKNRKEFKLELENEMKVNKGLAIAIINTYKSWKHRRHIGQIWQLLGFHHKQAHRDYCDKLIGKHLTGDEDIYKTLYFAGCKNIREKYIRKIPERIAMGDALCVAYKYLKVK